jgi:hypothetical protein
LPFDPAVTEGILLPLKIGFGILLGYILLDFFHDMFPPDEPDGYV